MSTVATKKAPKRKKVESIGKTFDMSGEEKALWSTISGKMELANEKEKSAVEIRQTANLLQQQWIASMMSRRSIELDQKVNIDVEKGQITVLEKE